MKAKRNPREKDFVPGTSRRRETGVTFRLQMAKDEAQLLAMGLRIKELRESHGYKQQWIADKVGVTLRTYQFWQQGKVPPEQENLEKLAELFGVTTKYILRGDTPDLMDDLGADPRGDQLDRIEAKLDALLRALSPTDREQADRLGQALLAAGATAESARSELAPTRGAQGRRARASADDA